MASRKEVPEERTAFSMDVEASDLSRPRMRIVTPLGEYQKMRPKMFEEGDIVIGFAADDTDAECVSSVSAADNTGVLVHVLDHGKHLTADKDDDGKKQDFTRYEIGDPGAPRAAKPVHEFVFYVPEYDEMMPVMAAFTPGSRSASSAILMAVARYQRSCKDPRELAFRLTTTRKTSGGYTWDAYQAIAVEPDPQHQLSAKDTGDQLIPTTRQLGAGSPAVAGAAAF